MLHCHPPPASHPALIHSHSPPAAGIVYIERQINVPGLSSPLQQQACHVCSIHPGILPEGVQRSAGIAARCPPPHVRKQEARADSLRLCVCCRPPPIGWRARMGLLHTRPLSALYARKAPFDTQSTARRYGVHTYYVTNCEIRTEHMDASAGNCKLTSPRGAVLPTGSNCR